MIIAIYYYVRVLRRKKNCNLVYPKTLKLLFYDVLIPRVHGSIPTKGKNSTSEGGGEDREVIVPGAPKARAVTHSDRYLKMVYTDLI
jgi:hypothetical protein